MIGALILVLAFALIAVFFRRKAVRSSHPPRVGSQTERSILVRQGADETAARCRVAIGARARPRRSPASDSGNILEAVSSPTWRSVGSVLRLELHESSEGTIVAITGWPGAALYDWGSSNRLVGTIADALSQASDAELLSTGLEPDDPAFPTR